MRTFDRVMSVLQNTWNAKHSALTGAASTCPVGFGERYSDPRIRT